MEKSATKTKMRFWPAACHETGSFDSQAAIEAHPERARQKRCLKGIPRPPTGRTSGVAAGSHFTSDCFSRAVTDFLLQNRRWNCELEINARCNHFLHSTAPS
jgi:hypothetical protein